MTKKKKPIVCVLAIYMICFVFRLIEYFIIRTDKTLLGEAFLHKLAGIAILYFAASVCSFSWKEIGFAKNRAAAYSMAGVLFGLCVFAVAYGTEILIAVVGGRFQSVQLYVTSYGVEGNIGMQTGAVFFLICIAGNIVNVVMEEGIFRGLFQKILEKKYTFLISAVIASALFGIWHIVGPLRNYYDGISSMGAMAANMLMLIVTSALVGLKASMLTRLTGSLYMAMGDHFVNNTIVNVLHVVSGTGADEMMVVRITIAQTLSFIMVLLFYIYRIIGGKTKSTQP